MWSRNLQTFIVFQYLNIFYNRSLKSDALKAISAKVSLKPESGNLLQALAENGRLKNLEGVINAFKTIMAAHRGEVNHFELPKSNVFLMIIF